MKKLISIPLVILLLSLLVGCKSNQNDNTSQAATIFTTTEESSSRIKTSELESEFHLFGEDMVANSDGYKSCELNEPRYIMKAKIPESWRYFADSEQAWTSTIEHDCAPSWGLTLYKEKKGEYPNNKSMIIDIERMARGRNDITSAPYDNYDFEEKYNSSNDISYHVYYSYLENDIYDGCIGYMQILNANMFDLAIEFYFDNDTNFQELFNVIDSIEIIDKTTKFYDFKYLREEALIKNQSDFYDKKILKDLKSRFYDDIINFVRKNCTEEFAKNFSNQITKLSPELYSAITDDFNGDGENESFVVISYKDLLYSQNPASILYCVDSNGNQSIVAIENYIDLGLITYPKEKQITYITSYGTGFSHREDIYAFDGEKVILVNTVNSANFEKDGPFLATYPRVGSVREVLPKFYYWVSEENKYYEVPYVKIPLNHFYDLDIYKKLCESLEKKYSMKVSGVATLAYKYYVIELTDNENNKNISIFNRNINSYEQFEFADEIFPYALSTFAIEGNVEIDYGYAVALAIK